MFSILETFKNTLLSLTSLSNNGIPSKMAVEHIYNNGDNENDSNHENGAIIDNPETIPSEQDPPVHIIDRRPYTFPNIVSGELEDFHYLHRNNLAQSYDFCGTSELTVYIFMFGIDFQCNYLGERLPFLKFLVEYNTMMFEFPKCEIMCHADSDDSRKTEMEIYFQNECKKKVLNFFAIEGKLSDFDDFGEHLHRLTIGYKEISEKHIVCVFDISSLLHIPLRNTKNGHWLVVDDLENQVLPISTEILQFFRENSYMKQIYDPLNNLVETPKTSYLYNLKHQRFMVKAEKSKWLEPRSFHPSYGNFYYLKQLSTIPYETMQTKTSYRKCVVFLKNYVDFLIKEDEKNEKREPIEGEWKNGDDLDSGDEETIDNDIQLDNDAIESDSSNDLSFVSLILFSEKGEHYYCVKTESIFSEL